MVTEEASGTTLSESNVDSTVTAQIQVKGVSKGVDAEKQLNGNEPGVNDTIDLTGDGNGLVQEPDEAFRVPPYSKQYTKVKKGKKSLPLRERWSSMRATVRGIGDPDSAYPRYMTLLEDRIELMEERWDEFDQNGTMQLPPPPPLGMLGLPPPPPGGLPPPPPPPPPPPLQCYHCQAKLGPFLWDDYGKNGDRMPGDMDAAIEITLDELLPIRPGEMTTPTTVRLTWATWTYEKRASRRFRRIPWNSKSLDKEMEAARGNRIPEFIRINSYQLIKIIHKIMDPDDDRMENDSAVTMTAPFKGLVHYEQEIRDFAASFQKAIKHNSTSESDTASRRPSFNDPLNRSVMQNTGSPAPSEKGSSLDSPRSDDGNSDVDDLDDDYDETASRGTIESDSDGLEELLEKYGLEGRFSSCESCINCIASHLDCLITFMDTWLMPVVKKLRHRTVKKVRFLDLWHLFKPGDKVLVRSSHLQPAFDPHTTLSMKILKVIEGKKKKSKRYGSDRETISTAESSSEEEYEDENDADPLRIEAYHVDYNGSRFVPVSNSFEIQYYHGEKAVEDLEIRPIEYPQEHGGDVTELKQVGESFVNCAPTTRHMQCRGYDLRSKEEIDGPVIVDFNEYYKYGLSLEPPTRPSVVTKPTKEGKRDIKFRQSVNYHAYADDRINFFIDDDLDDLRMEKHMQSQSLFRVARIQQEQAEGLDPDDYSICHYRVYVYILRLRKWAQVHVRSLHEVDIAASKGGFDKLVLPSSHKHMIKSQVEQHFRQRSGGMHNRQDDTDFVRGKGKGLIILLHGAPGVGKTSTAECIADSIRRPLLPITCGDLGTTAIDVEERLRKHFHLAAQWGCVMLLDEADVFLAKRNREDYQRNAIVSVFLRMLEYYTGLLFLTSNRVGTFDEAFKSRIHISLHYEAFDKKATRKVWARFIEHTKAQAKHRKDIILKIDKHGILNFAEKHYDRDENARWNGRQIRNAFQTALAMAEYDARHDSESDSDARSTSANPKDSEHEEKPLEVTLGKHQFEIIADTVHSFDQYMQDTLGTTYEHQAWTEQLRGLRQDVDRLGRGAGPRKSSRHRSPESYQDRKHASSKSQAVARHMGSETESDDAVTSRKTRRRRSFPRLRTYASESDLSDDVRKQKGKKAKGSGSGKKHLKDTQDTMGDSEDGSKQK